MVGKLFFLDDGPILKTVEGDFFIKNNIEKKNKKYLFILWLRLC